MWMSENPIEKKLNIGSGNGLVLSSTMYQLSQIIWFLDLDVNLRIWLTVFD